MRKNRGFTRNAGFTLIEVLVVVGMFAIVAGLVVSAGFHTHSGFTTKDDEDVAIATLEKARSQSMNGICLGSCVNAVAHGVHVNSHSLTLFQGPSYSSTDATNEIVPAQSNTTSFLGNNIIFQPLSGDTNATGTITIFDNGSSTAIITVGTQGQILWNK